MPTKISKNLPKRAMSTRLKEYRKAAWASGEARKKARQADQEKRHAANVAAGKTPKVRIRPRERNMRMCIRCQQRLIVAGSVCWCRRIGADIASRRNR